MKLLFWMLSFIAVVMTSIGGFAATHLITQVDSMSIQMSTLQTQISVMQSLRELDTFRLKRIEDKIDSKH